MRTIQPHRRGRHIAVASGLALAMAFGGTTQAAAPYRESDSYTVRFFDDFIDDLCGIATWTTLEEQWTFKEFADGSMLFHVVRTFIPDDARIPIEKGAGSRHTTPEGISKVVGSPLRLYDRSGGGIRVIGAGQVVFDPEGHPIRIRGQYPDMSDEALASYYCPAS
jgi:hypothetical protein